jgi:uncharacterized protein YyaL (SSP411 family)
MQNYEQLYKETLIHIFEDVPYKGWKSTMAGNHKLVFENIETGKEITRSSYFDENWIEDAWRQIKEYIDGDEVCVGDFVMVPSMQCTIYKVTEIIENPGDKEKRYMVRTPMKVMEGTKIKDLQFCGNEFKESEVINIKNW